MAHLKEWWNNRETNEQAWKVSIEALKESGYNPDIKNPNVRQEEKIYSGGELLAMLHESLQKSDELLGQLKGELDV